MAFGADPIIWFKMPEELWTSIETGGWGKDWAGEEEDIAAEEVKEGEEEGWELESDCWCAYMYALICAESDIALIWGWNGAEAIAAG
jgi:hypothetical protein